MNNLKNWRKGKKTKMLLSRRKKHPGNISALMKTTKTTFLLLSLLQRLVKMKSNIPFPPDLHRKVTCLDSKEDEILALPLDDVSQPLDLNISTSPLKKI
ncbi:hypothetical protein QTP88_017854 [Uroleucon formosanum]